MSGFGHLTPRTAPDELDQVVRLNRFRAEHQGIVIVAGEGWWQGRVPEPKGEAVITRYTLRELLDKLDALVGGQPGDNRC
jgi:hypothetical protein